LKHYRYVATIVNRVINGSGDHSCSRHRFDCVVSLAHALDFTAATSSHRSRFGPSGNRAGIARRIVKAAASMVTMAA
jgi:hypothetical protein